MRSSSHTTAVFSRSGTRYGCHDRSRSATALVSHRPYCRIVRPHGGTVNNFKPRRWSTWAAFPDPRRAGVLRGCTSYAEPTPSSGCSSGRGSVWRSGCVACYRLRSAKAPETTRRSVPTFFSTLPRLSTAAARARLASKHPLWRGSFSDRSSTSIQGNRNVLARKILVELWKYLETGTPPAGAVLKPVPVRAS
jgi:hypothetical protein